MADRSERLTRSMPTTTPIVSRPAVRPDSTRSPVRCSISCGPTGSSAGRYGRPVRVVGAVVLLVIGLVLVPAAPAASAASAAATPAPCAGGWVGGTPQPDAAAGVTRVDFSFAHRVDGRCRRLVTQV